VPTSPLFLLALNSPLYAPIVLSVAWARRRDAGSILANFEIEISSHQGESNGFRRNTDGLLSAVLEKDSPRKGLVIGVCDPMRLCSIDPGLPAFDHPHFLGALVDKMCYWLFDGDSAVNGRHWSEVFEKVLVHPPGYTGYTVAIYDMLKRSSVGRFKKNSFKKKIERILLHHGVPDQERDEYERMVKRRQDLDSQIEKPIAYLSTNPLYAVAKPESYDNHRVVSFGARHTSEAGEPLDEYLSASVMTALVTNERLACDRSNTAKLSEVVDAVSKAVVLVQRDPFLASYLICSFVEQNSAWKNVPKQYRYLGAGCARDLAKSLEFLTEVNAFNERTDLKIGQEHVSNTIAIREAVDGFLEARHRRRYAGNVGAALQQMVAT
jgi:hypothetical protein